MITHTHPTLVGTNIKPKFKYYPLNQTVTLLNLLYDNDYSLIFSLMLYIFLQEYKKYIYINRVGDHPKPPGGELTSRGTLNNWMLDVKY